MKRSALPDIKRVVFRVDPNVSALSLLGTEPEGYEFVSFHRKGTRAVFTYERRRASRSRRSEP